MTILRSFVHEFLQLIFDFIYISRTLINNIHTIISRASLHTEIYRNIHKKITFSNVVTHTQRERETTDIIMINYLFYYESINQFF
jgi:hypothetical protein